MSRGKKMVATTKLEGKDVYVYEGQIYIPNTYTAGALGTQVLTNLRDKKRIMGMRCPDCNRVYVPARSTCRDCFNQIDEQVEVGNKGTVLTYTVVHEPTSCHPVEAPLTYGIVQLDGADNGFVHLLGGVDAEQLRIGMRVEAVFKEEREGSILDIKYFKPLG
jgi:uncharacterized OB-fold protein